MSAATPSAEPPGPEPVPPVTGEVWTRFLTDTEERIAASAHWEPSADERQAGAVPGPRRTVAGRLSRPAAATGWRRWRRPVLVVLTVLLIAVVTFCPSAVVSCAESVFGARTAGPPPCSAVHRRSRCHAGESPSNSWYLAPMGVEVAAART